MTCEYCGGNGDRPSPPFTAHVLALLSPEDREYVAGVFRDISQALIETGGPSMSALPQDHLDRLATDFPEFGVWLSMKKSETN